MQLANIKLAVMQLAVIELAVIVCYYKETVANLQINLTPNFNVQLIALGRSPTSTLGVVEMFSCL